MKITYNFGQKFELVEIDMWNNNLIFKTTNGMGNFDEEKNLQIFVASALPKPDDGNCLCGRKSLHRH